MAKRKKKGSRRRIGSTGALSANKPIVKFGSLAAGFMLSDKIQEQIEKIIPQASSTGDMDSKLINGVLTAAGLYYLFMYKGKKNLPLTAVAGLAAGAGGKGLLSDFGILSGFSQVPVIGNYRNVPVVSGYRVPSPMLNGIGSGYTVPAASVMGAIPGSENTSGSGSGLSESNR